MRSTLLILLLALVSTALFAQAEISVRAGFGSTNLRTDSELDLVSDQFDAAGTTSFGVYAEYPVSDVFALRAGLETNRRGTSVALTDDVAVFGINLPLGANAKTRFNYIDVPLQVKATLPTNSAVQPYAFAGASLGYATGGRITTTARAIVEFNVLNTKVDLDAINYERFHVAATGGVGLKFAFSDAVGAFVEGRFEQSLTQPYDVPIATAKTGFKNVNFGAGVTFAL